MARKGLLCRPLWSIDNLWEMLCWLETGNSPQKVALRCRISLLAREGGASFSIAGQTQVSCPTPSPASQGAAMRAEGDGGATAGRAAQAIGCIQAPGPRLPAIVSRPGSSSL